MTRRSFSPRRRGRSADRRSAWEKVRLAAEILGSYVRLLRSMRRRRLTAVVAEARRPASTQRSAAAPQDRVAAVRLGGVVERVLDPLPTDNRCLIRSLVLLRVLARRGIDAELVIGVRPGERFAAHAWIEHRGMPVLPSGDYQPLTRL